MSRKIRNKWLLGMLIFCFSLLFTPIVLGSSATVKNVIVLMTDGTGSTHTTLTRWYKGMPLPQDPYIVGGVRTYGADSLITDSAPAASAFATGHKTADKFISVLPPRTTIPGLSPVADDLQYKPVATVLEGAKFAGKSTGLVATSNIQHASPAAFSAHWPNRGNYQEIAEQQVYENIDVVLSGGKQYLLPKEQGGTRTDGENLIAVLKAKGYGFVETEQAMVNYHGKKLWGLFADNALDFDMDRRLLHPEQPSLAEMTKKALEILSQNPKGFFLFVEASKVDWASHANDPIGVISDSLAYAEAIQVALDFAKKDGHTLVLCFADHSNGGMSIGGKKTEKTYSHTPYSQLIDPLKKAALTAEGVEAVLGSNKNPDHIRQVVGTYYGIEDLTEAEIQAIAQAKKGDLPSVLGPLISKRSIIDWTTTGHTGEDIFLYAYGPKKPAGLVDNTELAYICSNSLGLDLDSIDSKLFIDAAGAFQTLGATVTVDNTDPANPVLVIANGTKQASMPFSKNLVIVNGKSYELTGITVFAPKTNKVYISQQAVDIVRTAWKLRD